MRAADPSGNVVVSDFSSTGPVARRISPSGVVMLAVGLTGSLSGHVDGVGSEAQFGGRRSSMVSDGTGNFYIAEGSAVSRIGTDNSLAVLAGSVTDFGAVNAGVDGPIAAARPVFPGQIAFGPGGALYFLTAV